MDEIIDLHLHVIPVSIVSVSSSPILPMKSIDAQEIPMMKYSMGMRGVAIFPGDFCPVYANDEVAMKNDIAPDAYSIFVPCVMASEQNASPAAIPAVNENDNVAISFTESINALF